jgi:hypothetical protein
MYEPIRTKSVHSMAGPTPPTPRRSRDEELEFQLAGHFAALLTVTDELRALRPGDAYDQDSELLAEHVARLHHGRPPLRLAVPAGSQAGEADPARVAALRRRARALAGRALVVAESRQDEESAALATQYMTAHDAAA